MDIISHKICSKCHIAQPLDEFYPDTDTKDGKFSWCKACCKAAIALRPLRQKVIPQVKICCKCGELKEIAQFGKDKYTKDGHATRCIICKRTESTAFNVTHREERCFASARWKANHPDEVQTYNDNHKEHRAEARRLRYKKNPSKELAINKAWYDAHPEFSRQRGQRRRSRIAQIPYAFPEEQRTFMLNYWQHTCAVCGNPEGLFWELADDHWIPVTSPQCPGTIPTNIVPLCHGQGGCNNSKGSSNPHTWLVRRFGKKKARTIEQAIATYFTLVSQTFHSLSLTGD
jgi:hypothetical protein